MRKASESEFRSISTLKGCREEQRKIKRTKKDYPVGMGGKKKTQTIISQKASEDNIARRKMSSVSNAANRSSTMQTEN